MYNFDITKHNSKKMNNLLKKIETIDSFYSYKNTITIILFIILVISFKIFGSSNLIIITILNQDNFFKYLFLVFVSLFLISFIEIFFDSTKLYYLLNKELGCPVFIKKIEFKYFQNNEILREVQIPSINFNYNVDSHDGKIAVLIKTDEKTYKILTILNNSKKGNNNQMISSSFLKKAIEESFDNSENSVITMNVCRIIKDKSENEYITEDDIDLTSVYTEIFYL